MNNNTKTTLGLLTGIAIGGALGVLFAPKSGKETREDLLSKKDEILDNLEKAKESIESEIANKSKNEKDNILEEIAEIEHKISDLVNDYKEAKKSA